MLFAGKFSVIAICALDTFGYLWIPSEEVKVSSRVVVRDHNLIDVEKK